MKRRAEERAKKAEKAKREEEKAKKAQDVKGPQKSKESMLSDCEKTTANLKGKVAPTRRKQPRTENNTCTSAHTCTAASSDTPLLIVVYKQWIL